MEQLLTENSLNKYLKIFISNLKKDPSYLIIKSDGKVIGDGKGQKIQRCIDDLNSIIKDKVFLSTVCKLTKPTDLEEADFYRCLFTILARSEEFFEVPESIEQIKKIQKTLQKKISSPLQILLEALQDPEVFDFFRYVERKRNINHTEEVVINALRRIIDLNAEYFYAKDKHQDISGFSKKLFELESDWDINDITKLKTLSSSAIERALNSKHKKDKSKLFIDYTCREMIQLFKFFKFKITDKDIADILEVKFREYPQYAEKPITVEKIRNLRKKS